MSRPERGSASGPASGPEPGSARGSASGSASGPEPEPASGSARGPVPPIDAAEFKRRLVALCASGVGPGLPRKRRDTHILLRSMAMHFDPAGRYTERAVGEVLKRWLAAAGPRVELDHVGLRRTLVDEGYLARDAAGAAYEVRWTGRAGVTFAAAVDALDVAEILRAAGRSDRSSSCGRPPSPR